MKTLNNRRLFVYFIITNIFLTNLISLTQYNSSSYYSEETINDNQINENNNLYSIYLSADGSFDRTGKVFSIIERPSLNCYINNEQPSLNSQPSVYIPNYYISQATLNFQNIEAYNYTRIVEAEPSEVIYSSKKGPIYVYQKFAVEIDQFVNNVSIFIVDAYDPQNQSPDRFWEVAIVNCSNDFYGTPNPDVILGLHKQESSELISPHWEHFDFKNLGDGPIFLNTSLTNSTFENGIEKFWFALKIKIPPNDYGSDNYPKFLSFNQDEELLSSEIGEGETFGEHPDFISDNYTTNYVKYNLTEPGTWLNGGLESFETFNDSNKYYAKNDPSTYSLNISTKFSLNNLTTTPLDYETLFILLAWSKSFSDIWWFSHFQFIYSIDFYISTNISNVNLLDNATLYAWSYAFPDLQANNPTSWKPMWVNLSQWFNININRTTENLVINEIRDPYQKMIFLSFLNGPSKPGIGLTRSNPNNTITFTFAYNGNKQGDFNTTIDQFTIDIGEIKPLKGIQKADPIIKRKYFVDNATIRNGTNIFGIQSISNLKFDDDNYYKAQAESNNLSVECEFIIVPDLNSSLWEGIDFYDWLISYPNPRIPRVDIAITANVSITDTDNLTLAFLEVYKGNKTIDFFPEELNRLEWIQISEDKQFANRTEASTLLSLDSGFTWVMLKLMNETTHKIKLRLHYVGNNTFNNFNVSIDEFILDFYIQNTLSSDIAATIGLGLHNATVKPEDIKMKSFGTLVSNIDNQTGIWSEIITNGIPSQGIFEFNITSSWYAISFDVSGIYEIYKFETDIDFDDKIQSQYRIGTNYFTVEVVDGLGNSIEGLELTFELIDEDGSVIDEDTAITNEDGIAKGSLEFDKVGNKYKIKVSYDKEGIYDSVDITSDDFRIVDDFTLFMDILLIWLPYILIGLAALFTFVAVRHHKMTKLRRIWASDALILDDLLKITYIMIIHKEAGVTIYNKQISMELDSDLIGGFLTAISQFRSELKKDVAPKLGEKGFEMDYYDFKIVITDGDFARVALILDGVPSTGLKENQWQFTRKFEAKFTSDLQKFTGDIKPFRETDDLVDQMFDIKLMYPFQLAKHWEFTKLNKLEKALIEVAEQMQKERKFVYISSLLSYGLAGRKASRDQIISSLLNLKKRGILVPVSLE